MLCLANIVAIEAWELREPHPPLHPLTRWLAGTYLYWVPAAVIVCAIVGRNPWYASIAVSAGACALLFWLGRRLPLEARRVLVDSVLLTPLLFLICPVISRQTARVRDLCARVHGKYLIVHHHVNSWRQARARRTGSRSGSAIRRCLRIPRASSRR